MSIPQIIQHNFWLKLFSMMLAIVIWFSIKYGIQADINFGQNLVTNPVVEESRAVPIQVLAQAGDSRIFKITPDTVHISCTGESAILRKYRARVDFKAYVDLTEPQKKESDYEIRIHVPAGITVLRVFPPAARVEQVSP
jgi:YbbR domain-containing protein